jgi:thymidylate kinase
MKDKTVFIRIAGIAGAGKTTLAVKIGRVLKDLGIECEVYDWDASHVEDISDKRVDENLTALASRVHVVIQTEQMKRHVMT